MKSIQSLLVALSLLNLFLTGCAGEKVFAVHDEILTFPLPMDLAYLRTMEAVESHPDWDLIETDKEKGLIVIRNLRYSSFADADQRQIALELKRVGSRQTSVEIAPKSQSVVGGDEILELIRQYLG